MSHKQKRIVWPVLTVVVVLVGALALVAGRARPFAKGEEEKRTMPSRASRVVQGGHARGAAPRPRNLSLQPEAFRMGRRLGQRFSPGKREKSVLVGTLTIGSEQRMVQTTRTQTDHGEQVEIRIAGSPGSLTWDANQGARSSNSRATGSDRELIERLVMDSPDQFVLAQLRGAGYYTVARNARPIEADDTYTGALWDIVRVDDPDQDLQRRPQSHWRLYYLNTRTGLVDKVLSEVQGKTIETQFLEWTEQAGEKWPSRIVWTRQGTTLMDLSILNVSLTELEGAK